MVQPLVLMIAYSRTQAGTLTATSPDLKRFMVMVNVDHDMPDQIKASLEALYEAKGSPVTALRGAMIGTSELQPWVLMPRDDVPITT
jgi:hypothetical protein